MSHNFCVPIVDTDSVTICKKNGDNFSKEEIDNLTKELNSKFDSMINWEFEFHIPKIIAIKTKNYVLWDGKKIKTKGSALKATTAEPAIREFINEIILAMIEDRTNYTKIYEKYIKEATNVTDIKRWAKRKTYTEKLDTSTRLNETKVLDALKGSDNREGDRFFLYYKKDETLSLVENFDGDYSTERLLGSLFDASKRFSTILAPGTFLNYKLKRNKDALNELLTKDTINGSSIDNNLILPERILNV